MKRLAAITLCWLLLMTGCKTQQPPQQSMFYQPNWWERRMDRLDTWNHRNGQPIDKAKTVALYAMVATGFVAGVVATCALNSGNEQQSVPAVG